MTGTYQWSNQQWPSEKVSYCRIIAARSPSHSERLRTLWIYVDITKEVSSRVKEDKDEEEKGQRGRRGETVLG